MKKHALRRMKKPALIAAILFGLVAGSFSRTEATPKPAVVGHCGEFGSAAVYCEYETDPRSELKNIAWCVCYNFLTGELYID